MASAKPLDETLAISDELRSRPKLSIVSGKGRPPPRKRPDDFEIIFIEIGRLACETLYRASRITINRWLDECGKARLVDLRRKFVEQQRTFNGPNLGSLRDSETVKRRAQPKPPRVVVMKDKRAISLCLAKQAAHYLRAPRHGGWIVSATGHGDWHVGRMRMSAGSMLDLAVTKGFNVEQANLSCEIEDDG